MMPTTISGGTDSAMNRLREALPELVLAALAGLVFLGFVGSVELWGKREQRSSAEAIDTIDRDHWLVAQIQGRPRLEKPPLPRWTIAGLMTLTGRRDEWMVRLPSALSALGMVGLTYLLGKRLGGRSVGLASGLALTSMGFFVVELRQAGNDGPLAFFTTLAMYAAWRRLHGPEGVEVADGRQSPAAGARGWAILMYAALGFGFLCKGPIALIVVLVGVLPYLACCRKLKSGVPLLADGWGILLFLALAASWPVPVILNDPNAVKIWMLEMGQKAGTSGIAHHKFRMPLAADWPWMTLPWAVIATTGVALPFLKNRGSEFRPRVWFPWWWSVGNLLMFCLWSVAKPNYYLPCFPAAAVLAGMEWVRLTRLARVAGPAGVTARRLLQAHWVLLFAGGLITPVVIARYDRDWVAWTAVFGAGLALAVVVSAWAWRRGADAFALAPLTAAVVFGVLIGYGALAPRQNPKHSHRQLAAAIDRVLPPDAHTVMFFHELDEGLWFYLRDRVLEPVPGSQPEYNDAFRLAEDIKHNRFEWDVDKRVEAQQKTLVDWIDRPGHRSSYLLIRREKYDRFAPALVGKVEPLHRESDLGRNELVLLRVLDAPRAPVAAGSAGSRRQ